MPQSRRAFLQAAGAVPAAAAVASAQSAAPAQPQRQPLLPTVEFGPHRITRMIIGSNPLYGYSHFNKWLDAHYKEYFTREQKLRLLFHAEELGINTWQVHYNDQPAGDSPVDDYKRYRAAGGKMNLIVLADFALMKDYKLVPEVVKTMQPISIGHHGGVTDNKFRAGNKQSIRDFLKAVHDAGVMAGVSTHNPAVVDVAESEGWENDYYMTCLYRLSRTVEESRAEFGEAALGESFMERDPERMFKMIRLTKKPCLAFKVMGAGRNIETPQHVEQVVRTAYASIKPTDALIVGMYGRFKDEAAENTALARKILG
ncbi:MAG: twin-arginine translocation signal domain-containing protein [Bryobacteraceae bacterium]